MEGAGGIPVVEHRTACYNVPAEFAKGLLKRAPLEATHNKKVSRFDEIFLGFFLGSSLRGEVQRRAMSNMPAVLFLQDAEKLEGGLYDDLHKVVPGGRFVLRVTLTTGYEPCQQFGMRAGSLRFPFLSRFCTAFFGHGKASWRSQAVQSR